MASKIIFLVAVLCVMQVAHAASVQKRDLISDIVGNVTQQIQGGIIQAQSMIQGMLSQFAGVTANVTAGMQNTVTAIITQVTNFPGCATAMTINVSSVMTQAGTNVQNCSTTLINNLFSAYANVLNISGQAAQLQQEAQQAANIISNFNIFNFLSLPGLLADIVSRGMQLASQVPNVLTQMTIAISNATTQLPTCGPNAAATASQQLNTIWANVQSCVQSG